MSFLTKDRLSFKNITTDDHKEIRPFLQKWDTRLCDLMTGTLFMWTDFFENAFCIFDGALTIRGRDTDGRMSFTPPLCGKENERAVLQKLYAHAKREYGYLKLYPVSEDKRGHYQTLLGGIAGGAPVTADRLPDWYDYLYDAEELKNLSGKKYHGQRNFVNRFARENPNYTFEPLSERNLPAARAFSHQIARLTAGRNPLADYENKAVPRLLDVCAPLGQTGFLLSAGGKTAGLVVGEALGDTLYVHVEKADRSFAGAYPFLTNAYLKAMLSAHPHVRYCNLEEDMGDPGLRTVKEQYHPLQKLYKYFLLV